MPTRQPDSSNIVLTGFMGTGKTTAGRLLAEKLGLEFVDTDEIIEQRHGAIAQIFQHQGEAAFRDIERDLARELADRKGLVISTGGRLMLDPDNVAALSRSGRVFCLVATPDEILERVNADTARAGRPLLSVPDPKQQIVELLAERDPGYRKFPQLTTDDLTAEGVAHNLASLATSDPRRFAIESPSGSYDYAVGAALLPFVRDLGRIRGPIVVITNVDTAEQYLASCGDIDLAVILPSGRGQKNLAAVQGAYQQLLDARIDRSATIVSLGDSIVGDVAAFVAATFLRGLDLVHCPTDLIAMVDTSVGGKVGLDVPQGKNLIGLYKHPRAVVADVATLQSLAPREFSAGMAEVLKHGLIAGSHLLTQLEAGIWRDEGHTPPGALGDLQALVAQAVQVKIAVVQDDPFEDSRREVLNLGHTFAYAFEQLAAGDLIHGEAVGLGLVAASRLSASLGHSDPGLAERVEELVRHIGLATALPHEMEIGALLDAMRRDKKHLSGKVRLVLLRDIGEPFTTDDVPPEALRSVLKSMQP